MLPMKVTSAVMLNPRPVSRRLLLGATLALTGLLAACGDDLDGAAVTAPPSTEAAPATEPAVSGDTVTIDTPYGQFDVPTSPVRPVVLEGRRDLETALALGWIPIAVGENGLDSEGQVAPFLDFDMTGRDVVSPSEPNLEAIAALDPDVIIGRQNNLDDFADELSQIAPLVPIDTDLPWRESLEQVGALLHQETAVAAAVGEYDALLGAVAERHAEAIGSATIAIVAYFAGDSQFVTSTTEGFFLQAQTLGELGGQYLPYLVDNADEWGDVYISLENTGELAAADAILLIAGDDDLAAIESEPLWQSLPAVQQGHVVVTDARTNQGSVYAATEALHLLDALYATLEG